MFKLRESIKTRLFPFLSQIDLHYFIKNGFWVTALFLCEFISGILLTVFFTQFTSQSLYGTYNFLLSITSILMVISVPGLNTSVLRSIAKKKDGVYYKATKLSFLWSLLGIPILLVIGIYYYSLGETTIGLCLFIGSVFFPLLYSTNTWIALLKGKQKFDVNAKYGGIQAIIRSIALIGAILINRESLVLLFGVYMVVQITFNLVYYFKVQKYITNDDEDDDWKNSSYKLSILEFISLLYDNADKILIGILLGPVSLAIYVISSSLTGKANSLFKEASKIIFPKFFEMDSKDLIPTMRKFTPFVLILFSIVSIILILIIPYAILLLFSSKYANSIIYAQIYTLTVPLSFLLSITTLIMIAKNLENALLKFRVIGVLIILGLYFLLIPTYGLMGAIISSILYFLIINIIQYSYLVRKH